MLVVIRKQTLIDGGDRDREQDVCNSIVLGFAGGSAFGPQFES